MPSAMDRYRRLLAYESDSNRRALEALDSVPAWARTTPPYQRATQLLPHILLARRIWHLRLTSTPYENPTEWFPSWPTDRVRDESERMDAVWQKYLAGLSDPDLDRTFEYASSEGVRYRNTVDDVLTHVFNHGTYHRGQLARLVAECDGQRPVTDFIAFSRARL